MGTEEQNLKDQYNQLLNIQKNKLLRLKQKKLGQNSEQNNNVNMSLQQQQNNNKFDYDEDDDDMDDESDLGLTNNIFSKFDKLESMDSDSEEEANIKKNITKNPELPKRKDNKIVIKKNAPKKNDKTVSSYAYDRDDSESVSDKLRVSTTFNIFIN